MAGERSAVTDDQITVLRNAASTAARNLGLGTDAQKLAPEHWQRVLAALEAQARMRGVEMPEGWREELTEQMGRTGLDAPKDPES